MANKTRRHNRRRKSSRGRAGSTSKKSSPKTHKSGHKSVYRRGRRGKASLGKLRPRHARYGLRRSKRLAEKSKKKRGGGKCFRTSSRRSRRRPKSKGGRGVKKGGSGALVGYPWSSNESSWPGVQSALGNNSGCAGATKSNHFALSKFGVTAGPVDPPLSSRNLVGGKRRKRKGGRKNTLFPQDLVNFGRNLTSGAGEVMVGWQGKEMPASWIPNPTSGQPIDQNYKLIDSPPPNVRAIRDAAGVTAANL